MDTFWADIHIDLTQAILINFDFYECAVRTAYFGSTTFDGYANFRSFAGHALFGWATFTAPAYFKAAKFTGHADFASVTFACSAEFNSATFRSTANFASATFAQGVPVEVQRFWSPPLDDSADEDITEGDRPAN